MGTDILSEVRIDEGHEGEEAVVGNAEDADLAVGFGNVFDEPVDGVVGVGGMVNQRGVLRAAERAGHHVVALGAVLAPHVLNHADVAALDDQFPSLQDRRHVRAIGIAGHFRGVVGGCG